MTRDEPPKPVAPLLEYPSASMSPYDRPVEPIVTFARQFRLAVRILYLAMPVLVAIALYMWRRW
jgi:hypothetical protein